MAESRRRKTPAVVACKVETVPATECVRAGTGKRAAAQQSESGTPNNPPLLPLNLPKRVGDAWADA